MRPPRAVFAALAAAVVIGLAGCGGDDEDDSSGAMGSGTSSPMSSESSSVSIADFLYEPKNISVAAGTEITFTNEDSANHTATAEDGTFDTDSLGQGDSGSVTVDEPGTYAYICSFHPFMTGKITVEG